MTVLINQGFLQLSVDTDSMKSLKPSTQILLTLGISFLISLMCCGMMQLIIFLSKKTTAELILLRKNYKQYQGFKKFREFKSGFNTPSQSN